MGSHSAPQRNLDDRDQRAASTAMGVPLAKWALTAISAIFVCYVAIHYGLQLNDEYQKTKQLAATARHLDQDNKVLVKSEDELSSQSNKRVIRPGKRQRLSILKNPSAETIGSRRLCGSC